MIRYLCYVLLFAGVFLFVFPWVKNFLYILKKISKSTVGEKRSKLEEHIHQVICALFTTKTKEQIDRYVTIFLFGSGSIFLCSLWFMLRQDMGIKALAFASCLAILPYLSLRMKLSSTQITGSYEGETILTELLNQYKINHHNIREAIDQSIRYLDKAPIGKQLLFRLSLKIRTYRSEEELRAILDEFSYGCNTQWGETLSTNIYYAVTEDINITAGLEDLLTECGYIKEIIEQSKRLNNEAMTMTKFLAPATYLIFMWTLVQYFDFTIGDVIHYQIFTSQGLMLFFVMILASFICAAVATTLSRPKFDL